jgi:penicillin-binding protein 1A
MLMASGDYWAPVDFDTESSGWKGLITMRTAVNNSVNVYAVKLMRALGIDYSWDFAKNKLGLPLAERDKVLSLALGTCHVSTLDMASAYATFPANGIKNESYSIVKVTDQSGKVIAQNTPIQQRVMKETTAYVMNDLLHSVVTSGTGTSANIPGWYICGKTGTTSLDPDIYGNRSGNSDAWFAGYSPKYVGVVWMGYDSDPDKNHYLHKVYGGSYPAKIWKKVMTVAHAELAPQSSITMPAGITSVQFDTKSGLLPSSLTPKQFISSEICPVDNVPVTTSNIWTTVKVDPANPNVLAPEGDPYAVSKLVLNVAGRPDGVAWPDDEAPFKMPSGQSTPSTGTSPPAGNSNIPRPSLGSVSNIGGGTVSLPVSGSFSSSEYTIMIYIQRPGQSGLQTFAQEDPSRTVLYNLSSSGKIISGTYTFWAALMDNKTFNIGPPSSAQTVAIK